MCGPNYGHSLCTPATRLRLNEQEGMRIAMLVDDIARHHVGRLVAQPGVATDRTGDRMQTGGEICGACVFEGWVRRVCGAMGGGVRRQRRGT